MPTKQKNNSKYPKTVFITMYSKTPEFVYTEKTVSEELESGTVVGVYQFVKAGKVKKTAEVV